MKLHDSFLENIGYYLNYFVLSLDSLFAKANCADLFAYYAINFAVVLDIVEFESLLN